MLLLSRFFWAFLFVLSSCSSDSNPEKTIVIDELSITEGMSFRYKLPTDVSVIENQPDDIYFTVANNEIMGISPNVDSEQSFNIYLSSNNILKINVANQINKEISAPTRKYAFASQNIGKYAQFLLDNNDIPLVSIASQKVHYPVTVSKYAHDLYANYLASNSNEVLDKFFINAIWLRDNCIYTKFGFCSWRTEPAYDPYKTSNDWPSAMAQGQAISVMISAYSLTQDLSYLKVAQDAISAFYYPENEKGVMSVWDGGVWYEEYASPYPEHVLNGFIFAMAGLHDAVELLEHDAAINAFDLGLSNLLTKLPLYDVDFTSLYDINDEQLRFANAKTKSLDGYHELHILQLAWFYQVTKEPFIKDIFNKFLSNDIGKFNSVSIKSGASNRVETIEVSHSVRSDTNGPEWLIDRNWTYGNYWSTNRNGTEVVFNLNQVDDSPGVQCVMMSSIDTKYFPRYFDVYAYIDGGWVLQVERENMAKIKYTDHTWSYQGQSSTARTYCFSKPIKTASKLKFTLFLPDSNLIAIKEMDIHYRREQIENQLLSIYDRY